MSAQFQCKWRRNVGFLIALLWLTFARDLAFGQAYQAWKRANPSSTSVSHTLESTSNAVPLTRGTLSSVNAVPAVRRQAATSRYIARQTGGVSFATGSAANAQAGLRKLSGVRRGDVSGIEWKKVQSARKAATDRINYQRHVDVQRTNDRLVAKSLEVRAAQKVSAPRLPQDIGILRDAKRGKGNFGLGRATEQTSHRLGRDWVGKGNYLARDGKTLVSADGLRQFRPSSYKPKLGIYQANFERRLQPNGEWHGNGHLDIVK